MNNDNVITEDRNYEIVRWMLLPFATILGSAIGASILVGLGWGGAKMHGGMKEDGWYYLYVLPFASACVMGVLWAQISAAMAPRGKVITSIVMVTIPVMLSVIAIVLVWTISHFSLEKSIKSTVECVGSAVAGIISAVQIKLEHDESL